MKWILPFLLQALAIGIDECYFHLKRGLPRWERIGHPLDTLSVLISIGFLLLVPFSFFAAKIFIGLAIFSCLFVTKDEFVHKHHCPASEQWLHALLFTLHPLTLILAGLMWAASYDAPLPIWLLEWFASKELLLPILMGQFLAMSAFFFYQVIYWNFVWKEPLA